MSGTSTRTMRNGIPPPRETRSRKAKEKEKKVEKVQEQTEEENDSQNSQISIRDMSIVEWLEYHHDQGKALVEMYRDNVDTVFRRQVDDYKHKFSCENSAQPRRTKAVVQQLHHIFTKTIKDLSELDTTMLKEFRESFPDEEEDWFNDACSAVSSSSINGELNSNEESRITDVTKHNTRSGKKKLALATKSVSLNGLANHTTANDSLSEEEDTVVADVESEKGTDSEGARSDRTVSFSHEQIKPRRTRSAITIKKEKVSKEVSSGDLDDNCDATNSNQPNTNNTEEEAEKSPPPPSSPIHASSNAALETSKDMFADDSLIEEEGFGLNEEEVINNEEPVAEQNIENNNLDLECLLNESLTTDEQMEMTVEEVNASDLQQDLTSNNPPSPCETTFLPTVSSAISSSDLPTQILTPIVKRERSSEENSNTVENNLVSEGEETNDTEAVESMEIPETVLMEPVGSKNKSIKAIHIVDDEKPSTSKKAKAQLDRNRRRNERAGPLRSKLTNEEAEARRGVLESSSDEGNTSSDSLFDNKIAKKQTRKPKSSKSLSVLKQVPIEDDPKLKPDAAYVKLEKIDPQILEELISVGCISTEADNIENSDLESDSEYKLSKLERAIKSLMKCNAVITKKSSRSRKTKRKSPTKKSRKEVSSDVLCSSDDESSKETTLKKDSKSSKGVDGGLKKLHEEAGNLSDLESLPDIDAEETKTVKSSKKEKNSDENKTKKKNYITPRINISSSSDDSDKEDRKKVLEDDSDDDYSKKKKKKRDSSALIDELEDSDEISTRRKTLRQIKKKKLKLSSDSEKEEGSKKATDSEASIVTVKTDSDSDSDFVGSKKKKAKRGRASSSDEDNKKKKKKRRRIKNVDSDENSDEDSKSKAGSNDSDIEEVPNSQKRKKIRGIIKDKKLTKTTREAEKEEEERKKRVLENQKLFNGVFETEKESVDGSAEKRLILDIDPETKKPVVEVDTSIVAKLKPHQADGVKFMYTTCFESVEMIKKGKSGGCILAHCMGLGKTLQTVAFTHTVLSHQDITNINRVLIVCPLNTVNNWYKEYQQWLEEVDDPPRVHALWEGKNIVQRVDSLKTWEKRGGVGIIHYDMFRTMVNSSAIVKGKGKMKPAYKQVVERVLLDPGPELIVCDEGHLLKNHKSKLSEALSKIKTARRIVLTGTPLQNNLVEYHTMVNFVKPNLLGNLKEFTNRFVNPIKNGQCKDSSERDVKVMKRRAHVLHSKLDGCVQRLDYSVLVPYLPPKYEYCIIIKLSDKQKGLYKDYLASQVPSDTTERARQLLKHYAVLVKILAHPIVLTMKKVVESDLDDDEEGSLKDFICDDNTDAEDTPSDSGSDVEWLDGEKAKLKRKTRSCKDEPVDPDEANSNGSNAKESLGNDWWCSHFEKKEDMYDSNLSGKLVVLQEILKVCETIGDRVLVFSQYLTTLNIIEEFLAEWDEKAKSENDKTKTFPPTLADSIGRWRHGIEYFRIDGQTKTDDRQKSCDTFNKKAAGKAKLFLISTKAGGLGINLFGANRVVIFDASWNPSNDMQSIFRVYRFGQQKPCYIYRFVAEATMEEKIYNRQVVKLSLSSRVVDEHQVERHFKFDDINAMYKYDPDEKTERPTPPLPKDRLLANLLISHKSWIESYFEHDTLLINKEDEVLTEEERKQAWDEYQNENERRVLPPMGGGHDQATLHKIKVKIRERFPHGTEEQIYATAVSVLTRIAELRTMLNYYNFNMHNMTPLEKAEQERKIKAHQDWISKALGSQTPITVDPPRLPPVVNMAQQQIQAKMAQVFQSRGFPAMLRQNQSAQSLQQNMQSQLMAAIARNQLQSQIQNNNRMGYPSAGRRQQQQPQQNSSSRVQLPVPNAIPVSNNTRRPPPYARVIPNPNSNTEGGDVGGPDDPVTLE